MKRNKRILILLLCFVLLYFLFSFAYNRYISKTKYEYVYLLDHDYIKGEILNSSQLKRIKVEKLGMEYYVGDIANLYLKDSYNKNTMITKEMIGKEQLKIQKNNELVAISVDEVDNSVANQIERGSIVNGYFTAKQSDISAILAKISKPTLLANSNVTGEVTIRLLDQVRVVNCYDKNGNLVKQDDIIHSLVFELDKEMAFVIASLKKKGTFSFSVVR